MKKKFTQQWLNILCSMIPEANSARFMEPVSKGKHVRPLAKWPIDLKESTDFTAIFRLALKKQKQVCIPNLPDKDKQTYDFFSLPLFIQDELLGVMAIKVNHVPDSRRSEIFDLLLHSSQWLQLIDNNTSNDFYKNIANILPPAFEQESYQKVINKLVKGLSTELDCERIAFAELINDSYHVLALSNSGQSDMNSSLIDKICDAIDEAINQDSLINYPGQKTSLIQDNHHELAAKSGYGSLCTIPLNYKEQSFGAITLFRRTDNPVDKETIKMCQSALNLIVPFLVLKRNEEASLASKAKTGMKQSIHNFLGDNYLGLKLASITVFLSLLMSSLINTNYYVNSNAVIEGEVEQVFNAEIGAILNSASVQKGDFVRKGDTIATFNNAKLQPELTQLRKQLEKTKKNYQVLVSTQEPGTEGILKKVNLLNEKIEHARQLLNKTHSTAPFDGIIIKENLTQLIGKPIKKGRFLFTISTKKRHHITIKTSKQFISHIKPGQKGLLVPSSYPKQKLAFTVEKIAENDESEVNIYNVEAILNNPHHVPIHNGMTGSSKIKVGHASLLRVWTQKLKEWF